MIKLYSQLPVNIRIVEQGFGAYEDGNLLVNDVDYRTEIYIYENQNDFGVEKHPPKTLLLPLTFLTKEYDFKLVGRQVFYINETICYEEAEEKISDDEIYSFVNELTKSCYFDEPKYLVVCDYIYYEETDGKEEIPGFFETGVILTATRSFYGLADIYLLEEVF